MAAPVLRFVFGLLRAVRAGAIILGTSAAVLIAINLAVLPMLNRSETGIAPGLLEKLEWPTGPVGEKVLVRVFPGEARDAALERFTAAPSFEMSPTLHYMTARINNKHYHVGAEGVRYEPGWTDESVRETLQSKRPLIFLMGGSTTFGHGVSGNETISWHLNRIISSAGVTATSLNFGSQAYDQQREIEKLVHLLRTGHRPKVVVFFDGWNDVAGQARSNMRWQDKVIFHGFSAHRGEIAFTPGVPGDQVDYLSIWVRTLPISRFIEQRRRRAFTADQIMPARDPYISSFDFYEAGWVFAGWETYAARNKVRLQDEIVAYYRNNTSFILALSAAFDFKAIVLLQPMGLFDKTNPFVPSAARETSGYGLFGSLRDRVREQIRSGDIGMTDATDVLDSMQQDRYLDVAHYTPNANARLAEFIWLEVKSALGATNKNPQRRLQ